jgi:hypothetical protein
MVLAWGVVPEVGYPTFRMADASCGQVLDDGFRDRSSSAARGRVLDARGCHSQRINWFRW